MNFLILSKEGLCTSRPDSTRCKDNGEYFVPDGTDSIGFVPIVYARLCKSGKAVSGNFAERYYDGIGFGILLYPSTPSGDGTQVYSRAEGACYDRTSLMPLDLYEKAVVTNKAEFTITGNGEQLFHIECGDTLQAVESAIARCSVNTTIHKGDIVIAELDSVRELCSKEQKEFQLKGCFCEKETIDIAVKF